MGYLTLNSKEVGGFMRKANFKGRCQKRSLEKCIDVCKTYDELQYTYANILDEQEDVLEIRCNVLLEGLEEGAYTSDFVCVKENNDLMVRECVNRNLLTKPMTIKLLEASRVYWLRHGVDDGGVVINEERTI